MDYPTPEVGQVWEDSDPRSAGRQIRIDRIAGSYAFVTTVKDADNAMRSSVGHATKILLHRFRPGSSGYQLLEEG